MGPLALVPASRWGPRATAVTLSLGATVVLGLVLSSTPGHMCMYINLADLVVLIHSLFSIARTITVVQCMHTSNRYALSIYYDIKRKWKKKGIWEMGMHASIYNV